MCVSCWDFNFFSYFENLFWCIYTLCHETQLSHWWLINVNDTLPRISLTNQSVTLHKLHCRYIIQPSVIIDKMMCDNFPKRPLLLLEWKVWKKRKKNWRRRKITWLHFRYIYILRPDIEVMQYGIFVLICWMWLWSVWFWWRAYL